MKYNVIDLSVVALPRFPAVRALRVFKGEQSVKCSRG